MSEAETQTKPSKAAIKMATDVTYKTANIGDVFSKLAEIVELPNDLQIAGLTNDSIISNRYFCFYTNPYLVMRDMLHVLKTHRGSYFEIPDKLEVLLRGFENKLLVSFMYAAPYQNGGPQHLRFIDFQDNFSHNTPIVFKFFQIYKTAFITDSAVFLALCWEQGYDAIFIDSSIVLKLDSIAKIRELVGDRRVYIVTGRSSLKSL